MLYTVFFTQIMFSVDSLDPGHCPRTSILEFLKIGQVLFSPCTLHIYKCETKLITKKELLHNSFQSRGENYTDITSVYVISVYVFCICYYIVLLYIW